MSVDLCVENVVVQFGGLKALDQVSLTFEAGRITGLIGPNGSGKSTLVNTLSGAIRANAGTIRLGRQAIDRKRPDQIVMRGLARTYQIPRVPPELTVREIIGVPLAYIRHRPRLIAGADQAGALAEFCGLNAVIDRRAGELSVTHLRRLEIARALACGPDVLLLDEVMAGLSHDDAATVVGVIRQVHAAGVTIVIIEHVMRIIASLCDTVVVLNQGQCLASGEPRAVLADSRVRDAYLGKGFEL